MLISTRYDAIFDALTQTQRAAMAQLAVDNASVLSDKATVRQLVNLLLIATWTETVAQPTPSNPTAVVQRERFAMPLPVHIAWCEWISEHLTDDEKAEAGL